MNMNVQTDSIKDFCNDIQSIINKDINGLKNAWYLHLIENNNDRCFVYFIENIKNHKIKIGMTTNLPRRINDLQHCSSQLGMAYFPLKCKYLICCSTKKDCMELEKTIHERFKNKRHIGEWFTLSTNEIESFLDEYYMKPIIIHGIPVYCGFLDVSDMKMPMVIGYDYDKFVDLMDYLQNHPFAEYRIAIEREYGITAMDAIDIYYKYKGRRLDDFIVDIFSPCLLNIGNT